MSLSKVFIAFALFFSSVSIEQQVINSKQGLTSSWSVSVGVSQSYALQQVEFQ